MQKLLYIPNFIKQHHDKFEVAIQSHWLKYAELLEQIVEFLCQESGVDYFNLSRKAKPEDEIIFGKRTLTPVERIRFNTILAEFAEHLSISKSVNRSTKRKELAEASNNNAEPSAEGSGTVGDERYIIRFRYDQTEL